jgi:hypothetical protein
MVGLLVEKGEEIIISLTVAFSEDGRVFADSDKEAMMSMFKSTGVKDIVYKDYEAVFRRPTFADVTEVGHALTVQQGAGLSFDINRSKSRMVVSLLKKWDFKNDKDEPIPATEENVNSLCPAVGQALADALDAEISGLIP